MATVTVRGLTAELHARLRVRAARNGRSMEAEVRSILEDRLAEPGPVSGLGSRVHARFAALTDGDEVEFPRSADVPRSAHFDS